MNEEFLKRLKSFAWRTGIMVVVSALAWLMNNLDLLNLPPWSVALIGLVVSELTKFLNNKTDLFGGRLK